MTAAARCASCGATPGLGARFCRGCGAAVEATEAASPPEDSVSGGDGPECPSCGAPIVAGARFCHSCGESTVAPEPAPMSTSRSRGPLLALAAFATCLLLGGAVAGAVYLLSGDDSGGGTIPGKGGLPIGGVTPPGPGGAGSGTTGSGGDDGRDDPSPGLSPLAAGRYVQAGSFRSPEGAQREVDRLVGEGIDVEAVPADWAGELLPGFQVLLVGPLATSGEEKQVLRQLEDASVAGFGRDLTSSETVPGPEAAAGEWSGELERSHLRGGRRPSVYPVDFAISADGESGTVEHVERDCSGSLTLIDDTGYSLAYAESIESGDCPRGGVWHLRPRTGEITAVWLHDDIHVMVDGTAFATG